MKCVIKDMFRIGNKKEDDFTVTDMAAYCGVSRVTIYNIIENRKEPSVSLAIAIADFISELPGTNSEWYVEDLWKN